MHKMTITNINQRIKNILPFYRQFCSTQNSNYIPHQFIVFPVFSAILRRTFPSTWQHFLRHERHTADIGTQIVNNAQTQRCFHYVETCVRLSACSVWRKFSCSVTMVINYYRYCKEVRWRWFNYACFILIYYHI